MSRSNWLPSLPLLSQGKGCVEGRGAHSVSIPSDHNLAVLWWWFSGLPPPPPSICPGPSVPLGITKPDSLDQVILEAWETYQATLGWKCYKFQAFDSKAPNIVRGLKHSAAAIENANVRKVVPARNCSSFVSFIIPLKRSLPLLLTEKKPPLNTFCRTEHLKGKAPRLSLPSS